MNNDNNQDNNVVSEHISLQQVVNAKDEEIKPTQEIQVNNVVNDNNIINNDNIENTGSIPGQNTYTVPGEKRIKIADDSELLYAFIGNNFQHFIIKKLNFAALFFSVFYLLFRKMYFYSFVVTILYIVSMLLVKNNLLLSGIFLTINFIVCITVNKLYIRHCRNKAENIRYKHSFYDNDSLISECKRKGGTSIISVIVGLIINALIIMFITFGYFYFINKTPINDIFNKILDFYKNNLLTSK